MSEVMQEVEKRSKPAGTNKFELLFRLGEDLDVETILREASPSRFKSGEEMTQHSTVNLPGGAVILYADDSAVARRQIETVLTRRELPFISTKTGKEVWERLKSLVLESRSAGRQTAQKGRKHESSFEGSPGGNGPFDKMLSCCRLICQRVPCR